MQKASTIAVALTAFALVLLAPAGQTAVSQAASKAKPAVAEKAASKYDYGSVYLLRGFANIFSLGMNTLGDDLRAKGVDVVVTNHAYGFEIADELAERYKAGKPVQPIILIGHSLGANKTLTMSARLAEKGVPVRLVVLFDATAPLPVPRNVEEVLNLHQPNSIGVAVAGVRGYSGVIDNKDVSDMPGVGHISIDKSKALHAMVVKKVLSVLAEKPRGRRKN